MEKIKTLRKILSLFILLFALLYNFTNKKIILIVLFSLFFLFFIFDIIHYFSKGKNKLSNLFFKLYPKKKKEYKSPLTDATIFFISTTAIVFLFPKDIAVFSLILLIFCDASEQIFGILLKSKKLYWNEDKSWAGTIAGFLVSVFLGYFSIIILNLSLPLKIVVPAALFAAITGTVKRYDNILIPWSSALIIIAIINF